MEEVMKMVKSWKYFELIKFDNGSNIDKRGVRLTPSFLAQVTGRIELTFTQVRKTPEEQGFVRQSTCPL